MKRKLLMLPIVCSLLCLLVASCRKTDYKATPAPVPDKTQINTLFSTLHFTPQVITVVAGIYSEVRAAQGTKLKIYPYSFKDKSGRPIMGGKVQISIIEMYGAGAGVANRSSSLSGNQLLENRGQVYITASQDGKEIDVNKYGIGFFTQAPSAMPMALYYGNMNADDSVARWTRVGNMTGTAVSATSVDTMSVYLVDSAGSSVDTTTLYRNYNQFDSCGSLRWVGCNYPYTAISALTNINITPAGTTFNASNTIAFVVYPDINAVIPVDSYDDITHSFTLRAGYEIPGDVRVHIVVLGFSNNNVYIYAQNNVALGAGMSFTPVMTPHTINEVLNLLTLL